VKKLVTQPARKTYDPSPTREYFVFVVGSGTIRRGSSRYLRCLLIGIRTGIVVTDNQDRQAVNCEVGLGFVFDEGQRCRQSPEVQR
jgi:hypothetical protein